MPCFGTEYVNLSPVYAKFRKRLIAKGCSERKAELVASRWIREGRR